MSQHWAQRPASDKGDKGAHGDGLTTTLTSPVHSPSSSATANWPEETPPMTGSLTAFHVWVVLDAPSKVVSMIWCGGGFGGVTGVNTGGAEAPPGQIPEFIPEGRIGQSQKKALYESRERAGWLAVWVSAWGWEWVEVGTERGFPAAVVAGQASPQRSSLITPRDIPDPAEIKSPSTAYARRAPCRGR